jgi:hypothetical protein
VASIVSTSITKKKIFLKITFNERSIIFFFLGLTTKDDFLKIAKTLSSKNPDQKITASAAMDNSLEKSLNVDKNSMLSYFLRNVSIFDLKFCFYYFHRKIAFQAERTGTYTIYKCMNKCYSESHLM